MKIDGYYTTFDVVNILNLKMERFQDWLKRGFILPSIQYQYGRGKKKFFNRWDLYLVRLFQHLLESGLSREMAASLVRVSGGFDPKKQSDDIKNSKRKTKAKNDRRKTPRYPQFFVLTREGENLSMAPAYSIDEIRITEKGDTLVFNFAIIMREVDIKLKR